MVFRELVAFGNRIVSVTLLPFRLEVRNKVRDVQAMLRLCNSLLKDLDGRKNKEDRENELEIHIRDVVCRLEDVLDIFFFRYNSRRVEKYRGTFIDKVKAMREIMFKGRKIETMMSNITKERRKERIYTHVDEESVVGMEVDTQNLTLQIVDDVHQVICLYGIAGIGKTTMARRLYNHHIVRDHFEGFAWISTNSNIARTDVIGIILEKLDPEGYNLSMNIPDAELATKLHQLLQKKKCLLVLDDLTSKDIWKFLHRAFPSGETSSKILVTTRERTVAAHVAGDDRGIIHLMKSLNQQESWQLFRQGAFTGNHAGLSICPIFYHELCLINILPSMVRILEERDLKFSIQREKIKLKKEKEKEKEKKRVRTKERSNTRKENGKIKKHGGGGA
ncbi:putative disease resistance protein [Abeliophyllum distichum]|uniref:Disease resistance protein n=1 Tax=Abeliophyllum distichum TaxID=126358 RepID=A0ABD1Q1A3_9LAMI